MNRTPPQNTIASYIHILPSVVPPADTRLRFRMVKRLHKPKCLIKERKELLKVESTAHAVMYVVPWCAPHKTLIGSIHTVPSLNIDDLERTSSPLLGRQEIK